MDMNGRTIRLFGKPYRWLQGGADPQHPWRWWLTPLWPHEHEEHVLPETVMALTISPCPTWWQEQYAKDVAANRAAIETRLINPEEKTDA